MGMLTGPRMYYSLLGPYGLFLGAKVRFLKQSIQVAVEIAGVRHPVHLRLRTADVWLCRQILVDAQYDSKLATSPRVIVDAGANIGLASIFFANKYPDAKIIAIEPEPSNYLMLKQNIALYPNVFPVRAALWSEKRNLYGSVIVSGHHAYQVSEGPVANENNDCISISSLSVCDLMKDFGIHQIDLLKVDIEGSEKEVFQESGGWIEHVEVIAIEVHDWMRRGCSESVNNATKDFELRWQKGETTYFARTGSASLSQLTPKPDLVPLRSSNGRIAPRLPLKIIQVI